jgi:hypothetical protein
MASTHACLKFAWNLSLNIQNLAFGPAQIQSMTGILFEKANEVCACSFAGLICLLTRVQLRCKWVHICDSTKANIRSAPSVEPSRIEVLSWLQKTTLDIVGMAGETNSCQLFSLWLWLMRSAGFGYAFNSLSGGENELTKVNMCLSLP